MITQERLLELLRDMPEVHLDLLDLIWQLTGEDGKPDPRKISLRYTELEKAINEAEAYTQGTRALAQCLISLRS